MAAPKGNDYWKKVKNWKVGTEKKYSPEQLWKKAVEYCEWNDNNPLKEEKVFGTGYKAEVSKMRAPSIAKFCIYAQIDVKTFYNYEKAEAYLQVTARIRDLILSYKFEGAAAGLLESNIIARETGLVDRRDINTTLNKPLTKEMARKIIDELE